MTKTYLLIDLQNRKPFPEHVASWMGADGEAWIFFGEQEISHLAQYMELGYQVSLVDIAKPGKNSLDFHLVLYLGYLVARREPGARFVIVAEDRDYDPAIFHARTKGRQVERVEVLGLAPVEAKAPPPEQVPFMQALTAPRPIADNATVVKGVAKKAKGSKSVDQISSEILKDFVDAGKPKSLDALKNRIQWRFGSEPVPQQVADVLCHLVTLEVIVINDGSLQYMDRIV